EAQIVLVDTPGIHAARSLLNRRMVDVAQQALADADVVLLVVDASAGMTPGDREIAAGLGDGGAAWSLVRRKPDPVRPRAVLPLMPTLSTLLPEREVVPVSARTGEGVPDLLESVVRALPEGPVLHPDADYTTETERFLVQELVREQLFLQTEEEIPYGTAV